MSKPARCALCGDPIASVSDLACWRCEADVEAHFEALDRTRRVCGAAASFEKQEAQAA